ncbi:Oidioi.mRNA.OKI2018_I69.XSR.g15800.t1.cds [Oikopleura dioica]|uniref:Oidioi.mRNA.OKI2018_I69.XSR.g15800.t1.cds n=1 Tax=Oikopleura dioica TaxID=34765 RepID=A0ABN7SI07_OIKDI|nr:Oidioi.mRNA.OKI2018_I69.XSR.g15800.t1.cds [Oikopleura dioica]
MSSRQILTKFGVIDALRNGSEKSAAMLWVPGFLGTMNGVKAEAIEKWNRNVFSQTLWRFNYSGIGHSTENNDPSKDHIPKTFLKGVEGSWLEDIDLNNIESIPMHVLHPELDDICPLAGSEKLKEKTGCTLEILPGATH